jgi:putative ABC transport system permease protein
VVIVNEEFARHYFAGKNPVGKLIRCRNLLDEWATVIGVVGSVRQWVEHRAPPQIYLSAHQHGSLEMNLVLRTSGRLDDVPARIRTIIRTIDPDQPVFNITTLKQLLSDGLKPRRSQMLLALCIAALAILLTCLGVFGVVSYSVNQRTRQLGIRMALGAHPRDIVNLVQLEGLILSFIGILVGVVLSLWVTRIISGLLFGIDPLNLPMLVGSSVLLVTILQIASYLPARKAGRINPCSVLRSE